MLSYNNENARRNKILEGYLSIGLDAVLVIGNLDEPEEEFTEYDITIVSETLNFPKTLHVRNGISSEIQVIRHKIGDYHDPEISQLSGDPTTPENFPTQTWPPNLEMSVVIFYDQKFADGHTQPRQVIERIFSHAKGYFKLESLKTKIILKLIDVNAASGAQWQANENTQDNLKQDPSWFTHPLARVYLFVGMAEQGVPNEVVGVVKSSDKVCNSLPADRIAVVEYESTEYNTARTLAHEIGHLLGTRPVMLL